MVRLKKAALTDKQTAELAGHLLKDDAYDQLFVDDTDIYKPDGSLLCRFRQNVLSEQECRTAFPVWHEAATPTNNRGYAGGVIDAQKDVAQLTKERGGIGVGKITGTRYRMIKRDGTLSNTNHAKQVNSGIVGYFDRASRFPFCRLTAYNLKSPERFSKVMPFIQRIDKSFRSLVPDRYGVQAEYVQRTNPDFFIHGTSFTTVTVNRNFQTAVHKDKGDLKAGFGVMSCLRRGHYTGCYFIFPKYHVALDMRTGCVLCADVHEWHGNTPLHGNAGLYERVSLVFYYREKMAECGSATDELERAKRLRSGMA